jgi:hypothetical protein
MPRFYSACAPLAERARNEPDICVAVHVVDLLSIGECHFVF